MEEEPNRKGEVVILEIMGAYDPTYGENDGDKKEE